MISSSQLVCREAHPGDHLTIVEFQLAMALETEKLSLDRDTCFKGVAALFENPHYGQYFLAERNGQPVGTLLIIPEWSDWRNGVVWWIHSVYVIPSERGAGVFSALYRMIQERGEAKGNLRGLRLYVDKTNTKAQAVYKRLGMSNLHYDLFEWMRNS